MTNYHNLKDKPKRVLALTAIPPKNFGHCSLIFLTLLMRLFKQTHLKANRAKNESIPLTAIVAYQRLKISCSLTIKSPGLRPNIYYDRLNS